MKVIVSKSVKEMAAFIGEAASKIGIYPAYCLQGCGEVKEHCFLVPKSDAQKELFIKNLDNAEINFFVITDSGGRVEGFPSVYEVSGPLYAILKVCQESAFEECIKQFLSEYYLYEEGGKVLLLYQADAQCADEESQQALNLLIEEHLKPNFKVEKGSTVDLYKTEEQVREMDFQEAVAYQDTLMQTALDSRNADINRLFDRVLNHALTFPQGWV